MVPKSSPRFAKIDQIFRVPAAWGLTLAKLGPKSLILATLGLTLAISILILAILRLHLG